MNETNGKPALLGVGLVLVAIALALTAALYAPSIVSTSTTTTTVTVTLPVFVSGGEEKTTPAAMIVGGEGVLNFSKTSIGLKPQSWRAFLEMLDRVAQYGQPSYIGKYFDVLVAPGVTVTGPTVTVLPATTVTATTLQATVESLRGDEIEYSRTNVQVKGVDEQDIVKTNGTHIVVARNGKYAVVDVYRAYPPSELERVLRINITSLLSGTEPAKILLIEDNKTIPIGVVASNYRVEGVYIEGSKIVVLATEYRYGVASLPPRTWIIVYDTGLREHKVLRLEGGLFDTRLIGKTLVVVTNSPIFVYTGYTLPLVNDTLPDINKTFIIGRPESYTMISVVDIDTMASDTLTLVGPRATTLYVTSTGTVYLAMSASTVRTLIALAGQPFEKQVEEIARLIPKPSWRDTLIVKLGIDEEKPGIEEKAYTVIPGKIRKQWQMDEYNGTLRIVVEDWEDGVTKVKLYVLNATSLDTISKLDVEVNERVHGVRFLGDKLYLVTFRRIDPLFVIDLSNPRKPVILGYREGPGFDEYLHPLNETLLIGVGTEEGKTRLSLYRVEENGSIIVLSQVFVPRGATHSWSPVLDPLHGHRAFVYDARHSYILIPVNAVKMVKVETGSNEVRYEYVKFWGVAVIGVDPATGTLTEKALLEHQMAVRALYIDDVLYTIAAWSYYGRATETIIAWSAMSFEKLAAAE